MLTSLGFCHEHALILYVYLPDDNGEDDSVLTVRFLHPSKYFKLANWLQVLRQFLQRMRGI
jgi:hypothetical protein